MFIYFFEHSMRHVIHYEEKRSVLAASMYFVFESFATNTSLHPAFRITPSNAVLNKLIEQTFKNF